METSASASGPKGPGPAENLARYMFLQRKEKLKILKSIWRRVCRTSIFLFFMQHDSFRHNLVSDSRKRTPLHLAVDHGHLGAVELLVSSNADVNAQVFDFSMPFTHWVSVFEQKKPVVILNQVFLLGLHHKLHQMQMGLHSNFSELCELNLASLFPYPGQPRSDTTSLCCPL